MPQIHPDSLHRAFAEKPSPSRTHRVLTSPSITRYRRITCQRMSASPESSPVNGHASPTPESSVANGVASGHQSESDLSDVEPNYAGAASRSDSPDPEDEDDDDDDEAPVVDDFEDEPSEPSDNDASEDADFDDVQSDADADADGDADPDVVAADPEEPEDSESGDSRHAPKRKASVVAEDDYMRSNPELYGLRRSVCTHRVAALAFPCCRQC